jgi:hypothetical protein
MSSRSLIILKIENWISHNSWTSFFLLIFTTLINGIGVQQMGYYMPIYSEFLLYGTTLFYTIFFAFTAWLLQEDWRLSKEVWIVTGFLGLFTSLNGIFAQISIPYVDPIITTIIVQISAPVTWFVHIFMFKDKPFRLNHLVSIFIIFFGILFGPVVSAFYGSGSSSHYVNGFWILITLCSAVPTGFETLYQEKAYRIFAAPKFVTLTYYNLFSLIWYFLWSFMTMVDPFGTCVDGFPLLEECASKTRVCSLRELYDHQIDSWKCFFGVTDVPCCGGRATFWVLVFTFGYYLSFTMGAFYLRVYTSNSVANSAAVSTPLTSMFFWLPSIITGPSNTSPKWWIFVSFLFVSLGIYGYEAFGEDYKWNKVLANRRTDKLYGRAPLFRKDEEERVEIS